jgi:hypothetical protein
VKFVKADWNAEQHGFYLDPTPYLDELPKLHDELPVGARAFASDPAHYDMGGRSNTRCVKDLELAGIHLAMDKSGGLFLEFEPNQWKHDSGLRISYTRVHYFSIEYDHSIDWMRVDTVLLDEILPDEDGGCVHEIALTDATITVRCQDLEAVWEETTRT